MRRKHFALGVTAILVVAGFAVTVSSAEAAERTAPTVGPSGAPAARAMPAAGPSAAPRTVTLITGDRVTMAGDQLSVQPGKGREHTVFRTVKRHGHTQVVPVDALPLLQRGRLDPRLFDVTDLLGFGYAKRADLPLLVTGGGQAPARLRVDRRLPAAHGLAGTARTSDLAALWHDISSGATTGKVWLDGLRTLRVSGAGQIGAPTAWQAGLDGTGVTVAVIDSGIDAGHPDLAGKVTAEQNFVADSEDRLDRLGHGTHVASIIAGTGVASGGEYRGVAPGAKLIDAKACTVDGCPESALLDAMHWVAADEHAKVVNMSLGAYDDPSVDPLEQAVTDLSSQYGTLFVIAAGNDGPAAGVESPGDVDAALTVGAIDGDGNLADFSSRGPRAGDAALKPDITAPGVDITAALSKDSGGPAGDSYIDHSGTSMATPHVAGAAAILLQRSPELSGPALKATLMASAVPNPATPIYGQGAGRVDVPRSLAATLTTTPPSVSFGEQSWPHTDDPILTRTITYHNSGSAATTVGLSVSAGAVPAGLFTLSTPQLSVPAGGDATVRLAADTRLGADGLLGGYVVATAGDRVTRTPFAVQKEVESYDLTIRHVGAAGPAVPAHYPTVLDLNSVDEWVPTGSPEVQTVRLPKGRYALDDATIDGDLVITQDAPAIELDRARTITVDERAAKPVRVTVPAAGAQQIASNVLSGIRAGGLVAIFGWSGENSDGVRIGPADGSTDPGYTQSVDGTWARPDGQGGVVDSPYSYHLAYVRHGRPTAGFAKHAQPSELATVHMRYLGQLPGSIGYAYSDGGPLGGIMVPVGAHTPFSRDEYFNRVDGATWQHAFSERAGSDPDEPIGAYTDIGGQVYQPGHRYDHTWNKAVVGPATSAAGLSRYGDDVFAVLTPFSPAGPETFGTSTATGQSRLYAGDTLLGTGDLEFLGASGLPPASSGLRLELTATRSAPFVLSTSVTVVWRFTSAHAPDAGTPLPLAAVRFAPPLSEDQTAPAGRHFRVPVTVQHVVAGDTTRSLAVQVSYDDGKTWTAAPVIGGAVVLDHPKNPGFVSLRAQSSDVHGDSVEQTVIRAYRIG
jgi:hypothetical protein